MMYIYILQIYSVYTVYSVNLIYADLTRAKPSRSITRYVSCKVKGTDGVYEVVTLSCDDLYWDQLHRKCVAAKPSDALC